MKREPISLDRFILVKGIPAGFSLLLLSIPYGMTTSYVAMYAEEIGIRVSSGLYFTFMAVGLAVSRIFSGKQVDKGRITLVISLGMYLASNSQRGTATSTYLTSWDVGIGGGLMAGGVIAQVFGGFNYAYLLGAGLTIFSALYFLFKAGPHFNANKLR